MKIRRGDIVLVDFPYVDEPGRSKVRPAVVVQNDVGNRFSPYTIVIAVTSQAAGKAYPIRVALPADETTGLRQPSFADAGLVATIAKDRIQKVIGRVAGEVLRQIDQALAISLGMEEF
ncbi:Endoribonuclease EndoA [bacterium HR11]|nr:Endoribonuclease EndoA [bacterium HR11]